MTPPLTGPEIRAALAGVVQAYEDGEDHRALTLLGRVQDEVEPGSGLWAQLERVRGLLLIHMLREVEGTFALERADARLDELGPRAPERPGPDWPDLDWLEETLED